MKLDTNNHSLFLFVLVVKYRRQVFDDVMSEFAKDIFLRIARRRTDTNKYYVSILVENENQVPEVELHKFIGLDYSMHELYITSEGERANYPRYLRKHEKKLARLCRWHSRRKLGSQN